MAKKLISIDDATGALPDLVQTAVDDRVTTVGNSTYAPASAEVAGPLKNTVVLFGTSLENQNGLGGNPVVTTTADANLARGWFTHCNAFAGGILTMVRNAGIGGNTYAQMLARIDADVLAYDSDWVFVGGPTNDISQGRTAADIIADATTILDRLEAAGRRVLILNAPPSTGYDGPAKLAVLGEVNNWFSLLPIRRRGVIVVDVFSVLADPATAFPATNMANDSVHYSTHGALRVGKAAADELVKWLPGRLQVPSSPFGSVIANPHFGGNGNSWTAHSGVTATYQAADGTWGNKAMLAFSGFTDATGRGIEFFEHVDNGRWAVGDIIQAGGRIKWSSLVPVGVASLCQPFVRIRFRKTDDSFNTFEVYWSYQPSGQWLAPTGVPAAGEMTVRTPRVQIPAGTNRVYVAYGFQGAASASVEVDRVVVRKAPTAD